MASNVEQQQPWDDGVDICGQSVPMDNDEGWRQAIAAMNKPRGEPMQTNEDDDGGLYDRLMRDDARINAQLSDLRAAHRAGALDREAFSAQALERLRPKPLRDMLEVDASDPIAVVGRGKAVDEATLRALSSIVSGPRSSPEERKRWPVSLVQDPIIKATASGDRLVLRFRCEDDIKVWCWKMAHQVFANEGAGLLYTQNVAFEYPCAPTNLSRLFRYVCEGVVAADASGKLVLAASDRNLAYPDAEYGFEGELLSNWIKRTVARLAGTECYKTRDPPGFTDDEDDDLDTAFEKRWVSKAEEEDIDRAFADDAPE